MAEDEDYAEWLGRLEEYELAPREREQFREWLRAQIGEYTEAQEEAVWQALGVETTMEEMGIRAVVVTYPWGRELRYVIQGLPGLWGYAAVREIMEAEEGEW